MAQLSAEGTHGSAVAYGRVDAADVTLTPGPNGLAVSMGAAASNAAGLSTVLWDSDFTFDATLLATGEVDWGIASSSVSMSASAKPEVANPILPINPNDPIGNFGSAGADVLLALEFNDAGTVTSETLPDGAPVSIPFHFAIASSELSIGTGGDSRLGGTFMGTVGSLTVGGNDLVRLVLGNQIATASFDTAVGHRLRIQGRLLNDGEVHAGRRPCCPFALDAEVGAVVSGAGLWMTPPAGVDFVADSGTDYTQPIPEPGAAAAAASAGLALAAAFRARRAPRRSRRSRRRACAGW